MSGKTWCNLLRQSLGGTGLTILNNKAPRNQHKTAKTNILQKFYYCKQLLKFSIK